ncbi:MAG: hypothetical protein HYY58_02790 [Candidatus Omnitrophica bacterium]|nr:hypothetical protein [Candidatus Omnitrophota bacterium]
MTRRKRRGDPRAALAGGAAKLGALDYLPKPFDRDQLLQIIRGVLVR